MTIRRILSFIVILASLTAVFLITTDLVPQLRGPAPSTPEWYWPYELRPFLFWFPPFAFSLLFWLVARWWLNQKQSRPINLIAFPLIIVASLLLQASFLFADRGDLIAELADRTLSNPASGFFQPAANITDINNTLRNYPQLMPELGSDHAQTHPPGFILANYLTIQALEPFPALAKRLANIAILGRCADLWLVQQPPAVAAALVIWALFPMLLGALAVWPTYAWARQLLPTAGAKLATLLVATTPALLLFAPKSVQLFAFFTPLIFLCWHNGLARSKNGWLFLAALLLSLATFFSIGNFALLLPMTLYALLPGINKTAVLPKGSAKMNSVMNEAKMDSYELPGTFEENDWRPILLGLGFISVWAIYWLGWGVPPWEIVQTGLEQHYALVNSERRYDWWLIWNLIDLLVFAGVPLVLGFLFAVYTAIGSLVQRRLRVVDGLALATAVFLIALNLSGGTRGESGRIWLFFMPLLAVSSAAAYLTTHITRFSPTYTLSRAFYRWAGTLLAFQLLITFALGISWQTVRAVIVVAEPPQISETPPIKKVEIAFVSPANEHIALLRGFNLSTERPEVDEPLTLTLLWESEAQAYRPYTVFNQLLNENGELVAQQDGWSVHGTWPVSCWEPGSLITDPFMLELPANLPVGEYQLITGLYDAQTNGRLLTAGGSDHIPIATITIN